MANQPTSTPALDVIVTLGIKHDPDGASSLGHVHGEHILEVLKVEARKQGTETLLGEAETKEIMVGRVQTIRARQQATPWQRQGIAKKAARGDLDFPGGPTFSGKTKNDKHSPIVVFAEFGEHIEWKILEESGQPYDGRFLVVVTGDPTMHKDSLKDKDVTAPAFTDLFDPNLRAGTGLVTLGPALYNGKMISKTPAAAPDYMFYKYHVILLDSPWATHDPCIICGDPR